MQKPYIFSTLDDSLVRQNGVWVYSHALINSNDAHNVKLFVGDSVSIYSHEDELYQFIKDNKIGDLYACEHYKKYDSIWNNLVFQMVNRQNRADLPKTIRKLVQESHNVAKHAAKSKLQEIVHKENKESFSITR